MALVTVTAGNTILASDINQLVNVLQRQATQQEAGKYFIAGPVINNTDVVAEYYGTLSRNFAPTGSLVIDEADQAHTGGMTATPSTASLTANGFQVFSLSTTGANHNARAGGNTTVTYALLLLLTPLSVLLTVLGHMPRFL